MSKLIKLGTCDFSVGLDIDKSRRKAEVKRIRNLLINSKKKRDYASYQCGNLLIVGLKMGDCIEIYITTDYKEKSYLL